MGPRPMAGPIPGMQRPMMPGGDQGLGRFFGGGAPGQGPMPGQQLPSMPPPGGMGLQEIERSLMQAGLRK